MSSGRTPAIRNASPPTALLASWSARVKPTATGSPVVPEVTCMRTSRSRGAHRCGPNGGSARWPSRSSSFVVNGSRGQVLGAADVLAHAAQPLGVERARRLQVGELLLEGAHSRGGRSPEAASSSVPSTVWP